MINFRNQVPSVYTSASRDFQYMGWLINIVLNSVKHNVDSIYTLPSTSGDPKLTELLAMTLGFNIKRNYDNNQLTALTSILPAVLRCKGTEKAIHMAASALVMASGSLGDAEVRVEGAEVFVTLPKDLADITLFLDLLDYILPAGMTCRIVRKNEKEFPINNIELRHKDILNILPAKDFAWDNDNQRSTGLSGLYSEDDLHTNAKGTPDFTSNILVFDKDNAVLNAGLMSNTVIPTLADSVLAVPDNDVELYTTEYADDGTTFTLRLAAEDGTVLKAEKSVIEF